MGSSRYEAVVSFLIQVDRDILFYILPIDILFSIAMVAVLARGRRPLEVLSLFLIFFTVLFLFAWVLFTFVFRRPFTVVEVYSFP